MAQDPPPGDNPSGTFQVRGGPPESPETFEVQAAAGDLKPWDLDSNLKVVKGRHKRLDGPAKVTGKARYTFDINLPGMLWGKMIRATIPAGEIRAIDTSAAEAHPGVKAVWTTESRTVRFAGPEAGWGAPNPDPRRLVRVWRGSQVGAHDG